MMQYFAIRRSADVIGLGVNFSFIIFFLNNFSDSSISIILHSMRIIIDTTVIIFNLYIFLPKFFQGAIMDWHC